MTYAVRVTTNTTIAAGTDHQTLAAITGSPTSSHAPTILVSTPLVLRSPNQRGTWFTADMGDGSTLTNAVGAPDTHWGRTLFPLDRAIDVVAGAPIGVELHCDPSIPGSCELYWAVKIADRPLEVHDTRRARQRATLTHVSQ